MATDAARPRRAVPPAPLLPVAAALAAGIALDRAASPLPCADWAALGMLLAIAAGWLVGRWDGWRRAALGMIVAAGGALHHERWSAPAPDDLAWWIDEEPRPAWLRGVLVAVPEFHPPERSDEDGYTGAVLAVTGWNDGADWRPYTGRVRLVIGGDRTDLAMGHPVTVAGHLAAVAGPSNPGQFDARAAWRAEGIRLRMSISDEEGILPDLDGAPWPWTARLGRLRTAAQRRLVARLDPRAAPLAEALLLGRRERIDPEVNAAFARTGTAHVLAISGLHLQALGGAVFWLAVRARLGRKPAYALTLAATVSYAVLVGLMPSIVRAAAMTVGVCLAGLFDRRAAPANLLAGAAVVTLLQDPTNLFDTGCQLSFLAVAAIFWGVPPAWSWLTRTAARVRVDPHAFTIELHPPDDPLDALEDRYAPRWKRVLWRLGVIVPASLVLSAVVALVTGPLVALRFHLVSPIGVLLNVPLVPEGSIALMSSALALSLPGAAARLAGRATDAMMRLTEWTVREGAARTWGYLFTPGPSAWWVAGFYGLLGLTLAVRWRRRAWRGLGAWIVLPGLLAAIPSEPGAPEAEILDVGHGLAVVLRTRPGRAVLYDCGRMRDPHVGGRVIAQALWERGVRRLDAVIVSHADADHYDGLPDLIERFPIGEVIVAPGFVARGEPAALLDRVREAGIAIREVVAGDRLDLGNGLTATVLHPARGWLPQAPDNDRSLVLDVEWRGRHLLLTGDLDADGTLAVTRRAPPPSEVMLAPHHGGRSANPFWLYDWAQTARVVVSQRRPEPGVTDAMASVEGRGIPVWRTWRSGAVRLRWEPAGIAAEAFRIADSAGPSVRPESGLVPAAIGMASRSSMMTWLVGLGGGAAGLFVLMIAAVIEWGAWALVRPGRSLGALAAEPPPWRPIEATAPDGVRLAGAYRAGPDGRVALLLHGFGESRAPMLGRGEALSRRGWGAALADARGRGSSGGLWTTFGAAEAGDVRAWLDRLEREIGPGFRPVLWGRSMGAAIALRVADQDARVAAVVLEAPYAELRSGVAAWLRRSYLPGWLARGILRRAGGIVGARLDAPTPIELARRARAPVLIVHGRDDGIAPAAEVRRLAGAFARAPRIIEIAGARHSDVFDLGGDSLADEVVGFLDRAVGP